MDMWFRPALLVFRPSSPSGEISANYMTDRNWLGYFYVLSFLTSRFSLFCRGDAKNQPQILLALFSLWLYRAFL
jgi:hypothetical protein